MSLGSELRAAVRGRVLVPGDADFDAGRLPWNRAVEQPVDAVVIAADADDVAAVVGYAAKAGRTVATQVNGHGATGDTEGTILLRTRQLREVEVRPDERVARVGAGVAWGELLAAASPHGLTGLAGSSPVVSVVGYTLGGGLSWFGRKYGVASNSVRAFDVVTADGARSRVDADSDPELFWALRGGGGDFAVVTAMEIELYPALALYGGRMLWPFERAAEVLAAYREVTAAAPDELTTTYALMQVPPVPAFPEAVRGGTAVLVDSAFLGQADEGQAALRAFDKIEGRLIDTRAERPVTELSGISDEPTEPGAGIGRVLPLARLDDDAVAAYVAAVAGSGSVAPLVGAELRHLGGALARRPADAGVTGEYAGQYLSHLIGVPFTPDLDPVIRDRIAAVEAAMAPYLTGLPKPLTQLSPGEPASAAFDSDSLERLRAIKRGRDPGGVLRSNIGVLR